MRRAQITVFVLIGIILLIAVTLGIYLTAQLAEEQREEQINDINDQSSYDQLNQYLRSCLESKIASASRTVLAQGGVLYEDQNGTVSRNNTRSYRPFSNNEVYDVNLGVEDAYPCHKATKSPPDYPVNETFFDAYPAYECWTGSSAFTTSQIGNQAGYLGVATLPTACTFTSSNRVDNLNNDFVGIQCGVTYADSPEHALETHLEDAAENILSECAANTSIVTSTGDDVTLSGQPNVSVGYAEETTRFKAIVPFTGETSDGSTMQRTQFTYEAPVALVDTWSDVHEALKADVRQPRYNLSENLASYSVTQEQQSDTTFHVVQDPDTTWGGDPLTIVAAIEDRAPVLNHIDRDTSDADIVVNAGEDLTLNPKTVDPDDHYEPRVSYGGLGEDHRSIDATGRTQPSDPLTDAQPVGVGSAVSPGNKLSDAPNGTHRIRDPYNWGLYTTTVNAQDRTGSIGDYQDVDVLIVDNPRLQLTAKHPLGQPVSEEAPIIVNGSSSRPPKAFGQTPLFNVEWRVNNTVIPANITGFNTSARTAATIQTIDTKNDNLQFSTNNANISLSAEANTTYKDEIHHEITENVTVHECRRNDDAGLGNPYPYNQTNPYRTPNPCCTGTPPSIVPASQQKTCYSDTEFDNATNLATRLQAFNQTLNDYSTVSIDYTEINNAHDNLTSQSGTAEIHIQRFCGGTRGNTCGGHINITVD